MIARIAVSALPSSPLRRTLSKNESMLQRAAVAPDTTLRQRYGKAEARRHFIDLEEYGSDPFAELSPNIHVMFAKYGRYRVDKAGTLPWSIAQEASRVGANWRSGACGELVLHSGYLAHYVGDASQPLHTTIHFDCDRTGRGCHARIESAVDHRTREIERSIASEIRPASISSVWSAAIAEIRRSHSLVSRLMSDDRTARRTAPGGPLYTSALFKADAPLFDAQLADAASTLASIWLFEWREAGSPDSCQEPLQVN